MTTMTAAPPDRERAATRPPARRAASRRWKPSRVVLFVLLVGIAVVMLYPFFFMADASLRSQAQFDQGSGHSWSSWGDLLHTLPVGRQLLNSTIVCLAAIAVILAAAAPAGFAFAKLRYRGSTAVFLGVVGAMLVPLQSIIVPLYVNMAHVGLINNYLGAVLVYAAFGTPFATFLMTTYYRGLPDELVEAAVVDGHGYFGIFRRIAVPMAVPALVTVTVLQFIQIWDDLLIGLLFLQNPDNRTITVGLATLSSGRVTSIPILMAGSLLSAVPAIVVYLIFQRHLVKGLTLGIGK